MRTVRLLQPSKIMFGGGCAEQCAHDVLQLGLRSVFIVTDPQTTRLAAPLENALREGGAGVTVYVDAAGEPSVATFEAALAAAKAADHDAVIGLGGGSRMDTAKLVAALYDGRESVRDVFGIDTLTGRPLHLACLPTTAGTGSEVSPIALMLDEAAELKKAVVSPYLVPDAAYVDPLLTMTVPPAVTAATGLDALTHCIEAYTNRFAHPMVDLYALQGIRLIGASLLRAVENGDDVEARTNMAMGSLYGGLCLGPVNTAAVHALSYPLGSRFHVAHGVSNAVLLPHVMRYNLSSAPERYAQVGLALGVDEGETVLETAQRGADRVTELYQQCGIPARLTELGVPEEAIEDMVRSAMTVTRLLKNNPRELTASDAEAVYRAAF